MDLCVSKGISRIVLLLLIPCWAVGSRAAEPNRFVPESSRVMTFDFANNSSLLMLDYRTNEANLSQLDRMLRNSDILSLLDSVVIESGGSMIGSIAYNTQLSRDRSEAIRSYICWQHPQIPRSKIRTSWTAINWKALYRLVENDPSVPYRSELLQIVSSPMSESSKVAQINWLGTAKSYIETNFSRYTRSATCVVFYLRVKPEELSPLVEEPQPEEHLPTIPIVDSVSAPEPAPLEEPTAAPFKGVIYNDYTRKPLFALKTNLLFDAVLALNLELEVPIGRRWSVSGEVIFPWWLWEKEQYCLQVLSGNIEGRYWFGNREKQSQLTGWFAGVYAGAGIFDVEWKTKGYQGEFFLSAGVSGGYAHTVNKSGTLRMEYSLGLGYMQTHYREYVPQYGLDNEWHLIRQQSGTFTWIGPTRAKISLVWLIHHGYQKKGGLR